MNCSPFTFPWALGLSSMLPTELPCQSQESLTEEEIKFLVSGGIFFLLENLAFLGVRLIMPVIIAHGRLR